MGAFPHGGVIGILGGGQLGRMLAAAARRLGLGVAVWSPDADAPAFGLADLRLHAPFDDAEASDRFARAAGVVTLEFENVPLATVGRLAERVPVRPGPGVLGRTQDRRAEKRFVAGLGIPVAPFAVVDGPHELEGALATVGAPAILKSARLGYDGKGQVAIPEGGVPAAALALAERGPCVLERRIELAAELSVIVARAPSGDLAAYPPFENRHQDGILDLTVVPARVTAGVADEARRAAVRIAEAIGLEGILAVEAFVSTAGELLVNELAPRPHNSGHVTCEACDTDQFEQAVRAVADLPLGSVRLRSPGAMANLLGDLWTPGPPAFERALALDGVHLHLYGKTEARAGRKMGHLTALGPDPGAAAARVREAREALACR